MSSKDFFQDPGALTLTFALGVLTLNALALTLAVNWSWDEPIVGETNQAETNKLGRKWGNLGWDESSWTESGWDEGKWVVLSGHVQTQPLGVVLKKAVVERCRDLFSIGLVRNISWPWHKVDEVHTYSISKQVRVYLPNVKPQLANHDFACRESLSAVTVAAMTSFALVIVDRLEQQQFSSEKNTSMWEIFIRARRYCSHVSRIAKNCTCNA